MYKQMLSVLILLVATIAVIIFAYYATIIIGKKTNRFLNSRYIQILERTSIGLNTNITILKINEKIYIIAIQGKSVELLDIVNKNDWKFLNDKDKTQLYTENTNENFLITKLFNKTKKIFGNNMYSENGSDNDEQNKV